MSRIDLISRGGWPASHGHTEPSAAASSQRQLAAEMDEFRQLMVEQHRAKFQDVVNQQLVNLHISLVGQANKARDKVQS